MLDIPAHLCLVWLVHRSTRAKARNIKVKSCPLSVEIRLLNGFAVLPALALNMRKELRILARLGKRQPLRRLLLKLLALLLPSPIRALRKASPKLETRLGKRKLSPKVSSGSVLASLMLKLIMMPASHLTLK